MTGSPEERWAKLQDWFEQAMDLPVAERARFVASLEAGDDLRRELQGMIRVASSGGLDIGHSISKVAETASASLGQPRRFGPYRIVRELGHGGMGVVYEAEREDEFRQRVALKIAPQWRGEEQLHARIRHERQVLASLDHPNIARLIDGGSENGVPYFAMEYVEGTPLTVFVKERGFPFRDRVALFQQILAAVQYAHLRMVVHRDLKPSNILVTAMGVPKLLDFGIAKILDPMAGPSNTATAMMWTPDYASPEQVRGLPVTAQTDVYSLGLILYELLTGVRAQTADTSSPLALDQSICEKEAPAASTVVSDAKLVRQLAGDLDNIMAKAMAKEPGRRYASVADFSADLTRYSDGLPVVARPNTFSYRAAKFLRRHKAMVAGAVLLAVSIAGGFLATLHQARRAESRFQQVRSLANAFVFDVHDRIQFLPGSTPARQAIVQTALRYLENLQADASSDPSLARELAAAYLRIGDVQGNPTISNLGDRDGALASYRKGQALLARLVAGGDRESRLALAGMESALALVTKEKGDRKASLLHYESACRLADAVLADVPDDRAALRFTASLYADWTRTLVQLQDARALAASDRAMRVASQMVAADPSNLDSLSTLAAAHNGMGAASLAAAELEKAAASYRESVRIRAELVARAPQNVAYRRDLVIGFGTLGEVLGSRTGENLGDAAGAIAAMESALEHTRWLRSNDPADKRAVFDDLSVRMRLGAALIEGRRLEEALRVLRAALVENDALLKDEPANYRYRLTSGFLLRKQGEALAGLGRETEAESAYRRSLERYAALLSGPNEWAATFSVILLKVQLALLGAQSNPAAARGALEDAVGLIEKTPGAVAAMWNRAKVTGDVGRAYARLGDAARARKWLDESAGLWRRVKTPQALEAARSRELEVVEGARRGVR